MRKSLRNIYMHVTNNYIVKKYCNLISNMSSDTFKTTEKPLKTKCKKDKNQQNLQKKSKSKKQ